ncbi:helix-turn-helix domain-containing protein [Natrinema sp. 74]|uniref:helix-turn-helix domain-containing protein n=1 Tax=Natrinema sp. 74 TaxID=3384159 RepID=UPI0038D3824E
MLLATFWVDYPILREALSNAPNVTITWEQSDLIEGEAHQMHIWTEGGDFESFDAGLKTDPTINPPSQVATFGERRLYQVKLTSRGRQTSIYPAIIEERSVMREVTATADGWNFSVAFPDTEALERYHGFFLERNIDIEIRELYEDDEPFDNVQFQYGLTELQRETLVAAVEAGYLDIPRSCSLAELGERFDISPNAASERFRRGVKALVENTVYDDRAS